MPSSATSAGLQLRIGCHSDSLMKLNSLKRFPIVTKTTDLDQELISTKSAFGGLLYVTVPAGATLGSISVTISGGFLSPMYVHGRDSLADWQAQLAASASPWGELVSSKLIITVPSPLLKSSAAADPITLMNTWDLLMDAAADLEGTSHARVREERFVADRQISAGWMHSGYPIMGYGSGADSFLLVDVNDGNGWGPFHELGHNHQSRGWFLPGAPFCRTIAQTHTASCRTLLTPLFGQMCHLPQAQPKPRATSGPSRCTTRSVYRRQMAILRSLHRIVRRGWPTTERTRIK